MTDDGERSEAQKWTETDLIERYDGMIQTQIDTLQDIDTKAAKAVRMNVLLIGVFLTAVSIISDSGLAREVAPTVQWAIGLGIGLLLLSVGFGILAYLSSVFRYGPPVSLGSEFAQYRVTEQDYRDYLLELNSEIIRENRTVIENNSRRFRRSLLCLLLGMLYVSVGVGFAVTRLSGALRWSIPLALVALTAGLVAYVEGEAFLTLERQRSRTNDE